MLLQVRLNKPDWQSITQSIKNETDGVCNLQTPYCFGVFKEGHSDGFQHYSILFPGKKLGIVILTNSDNGERVFKELLKFAIGDEFTPWKWQRYIPDDQKIGQ